MFPSDLGPKTSRITVVWVIAMIHRHDLLLRSSRLMPSRLVFLPDPRAARRFLCLSDPVMGRSQHVRLVFSMRTLSDPWSNGGDVSPTQSPDTLVVVRGRRNHLAHNIVFEIKRGLHRVNSPDLTEMNVTHRKHGLR